MQKPSSWRRWQPASTSANDMLLSQPLLHSQDILKCCLCVCCPRMHFQIIISQEGESNIPSMSINFFNLHYAATVAL